jgi:GxxExxY protein
MRLDVVVDDGIIVENKAVERILPLLQAQLLTYMKLLNLPLGLLFDYNDRSNQGECSLNPTWFRSPLTRFAVFAALV